MRKFLSKSMFAVLAFMLCGVLPASALESYDFQELCMKLYNNFDPNSKAGPWAVLDGGDAGFTLGTEEEPVVMHFMGDYTDYGFEWNSRFAYEYVEGRGKFTMRNKNNKKDSNCGMFSWDYAHHFSILGLKNGDKVTITIGTGTVTFANETAENVSEGDKVVSKQAYTIATNDETTRLDIIMEAATLIAKIEIEPYGVETVPVIKVTPQTLKLIPTATAKLTASVSPSMATVWASSDETVATVAADGTVTAIAAGEAIITNSWESEVSDATAADTCIVTVADIDLSKFEIVRSYDFTAMGDVTLVLQSEAAGAIWNEANSKNNNVFFCTNEGLEDIAVQAAVSSNKGWSIVDGKGLFLATGAGRCAAIGGIEAGQVVELFYTGSGFYTRSEDDGIEKAALNEGVGRAIYQAGESGMIGFELDKGNALTGVNVYATAKKVITLAPGVWEQDDAVFAVYAWNSNGSAWFPFVSTAMARAAAPEAGNLYVAEVPENFTSIIIVRLMPATAEGYNAANDGLNWDNKWNQTSDIDFTAVDSETTFSITDWGEDNSEYAIVGSEVPATDIYITPESGADIAVALAAAEEGIDVIGDIYVELAQNGNYTISGSLTAPHNFYLWGNDATIDASGLEAPMTTLTEIAEPTEWTVIDHFEIKGVTVKNLKNALFYSSCKNYYIDMLDIDWVNVDVAADVTVFDFTKGSVANLCVQNSTIYAPTATTKSFYSSQLGQRANEIAEGTQQNFIFKSSTFYNLAPTKNFFSHRTSNQTWMTYDVQNNIFVNCGKSGQAIKGMNGGSSGKNPTWIIKGNAFNFDGADTSAAEETGDADEPVQESVAGVVTFTDAANGDFNGTFELAEGATAPQTLGAPMWTITFSGAVEEAKLYVIGTANNWDRTNMEELTFDEAADSYKYVIDTESDFYFAFATYQLTAEEAAADPNWDTFNTYRYAIGQGDQTATLDTDYQLQKVNGTIKLGAGHYNVYVTKDFKMTIKDALTDGISTVTTTADNAVIYNMKGQRVMNAQKGLYIMNGKKVVKK